MSVKGLFITGTNTGVGKTHVAAMIARWLVGRGCRVGVYKPVASGCIDVAHVCANGGNTGFDVSPASSAEREGGTGGDAAVQDDATILWRAAGMPGEWSAVCPQRFAAPVAPHLAARLEGRVVDARLLRTGIESWKRESDVVLIEGAGGLMSPVTDDEYVADLAADFGYPLLIVACNVLGTINQTLLTLIAAETFPIRLPVAGIVLNNVASSQMANDASRTLNRQELESRCVPPLLAEVAFGAEEFGGEVDWLSVMEVAKARGRSD